MPEVREPSPRPSRHRRLVVWVDEHVSPSIAKWLAQQPFVEARSFTALGLTRTPDEQAFRAARDAGADVLVTKDRDFVRVLRHAGAPPQVVLLVCGNCSNVELRDALARAWPRVLAQLRRGVDVIEVERPA